MEAALVAEVPAGGALAVDREDDIVAACLLCTGGEIIRKNG